MVQCERRETREKKTYTRWYKHIYTTNVKAWRRKKNPSNKIFLIAIKLSSWVEVMSVYVWFGVQPRYDAMFYWENHQSYTSQTKYLSPKYQVEPLSKSLHPTIFHLHKEILWKKNINYSFQWIRHCFLLVTEFDRLLSRCFESIRHTTERQRLGGGGGWLVKHNFWWFAHQLLYTSARIISTQHQCVSTVSEMNELPQ